MTSQLFEARLEAALRRVKTVLHVERKPCFAAQSQHSYQDKYLLAEALTNAAAASQTNCLAAGIGLSAERLTKLAGWLKAGSSISLSFVYIERCDYDRMETREVESPTKHVMEASMGGVVRAALTSKVVTTVEDHFWKCLFSVELAAIRGVGDQAEDRISLHQRSGVVELKTGAKSPPRHAVSEKPMEVNISWLVRQLSADSLVPQFHIDRDSDKCHTPRRNQDVEQAIKHFTSFMAWGDQVTNRLKDLFSIRSDGESWSDFDDVVKTWGDDVFVPVLPLLREAVDAGAGAPAGAAPGSAQPEAIACFALAPLPAGSTMLEAADTNALLAEEVRQLREKHATIQSISPTGHSIAGSAAEGIAMATLRHCRDVAQQYLQALAYIEDMLRQQLIAAIGKEVSPADFAEYMRFHFSKNFREAYAPRPFCYAIRRSDQHSPEGTLAIEEEVVGSGGDSNIAAPIATLCAQAAHAHTMHFALGASTNVKFRGERYLHAYLQHQFSGQSGAKLSLVSRARQFSSMIVLVGRISSATVFEPMYASIVQNKDELTIPLDLSTIPTAKEFKDAIESLSPEQQAFAKAFRSMQLESTLFGILVIQIKPQLEKVLNLASGTLTKEIKLTQDLMQLFIKYQISSDLLSYEANAAAEDESGAQLEGDAPASERLAAVRDHVAAMMGVIDEAKKAQMEEARLKMEYEMAQKRAEEEARRQAEQELKMRLREQELMQSRMECVDMSSDMLECESFQTKSKRSGSGLFGGLFKSAKAPLSRAFAAPMMECAAMPAMASMAYSDICFEAAPMPCPAAPTPSAAAPPQTTSAAASAAAPGGGEQAKPAADPAQPQQPEAGDGAAAHQETAEVIDYTQVPKEMDARFERLDTDNALRPTIINPGEVWHKREQKALLAKPSETLMTEDAQKRAKDEAFDLLDALTKSGGLHVEDASLHVVIAATHCFDKTVTETVIQGNANPIEKVERSALIMASTVHQLPPAALLRDTALPRVTASAPGLFLEDA